MSSQSLRTAWHGPFLEPPVEVRAVEGQGNGLFAKRNIDKGEIIFTEVPLMAAAVSQLKHCHHCLKCLAPAPATLPSTDAHWPSFEPLECPGCDEVAWCSESCRRVAEDAYHNVMCRGRAEEEQCRHHIDSMWSFCRGHSLPASMANLLQYPLLAAKLIAAVLSRARNSSTLLETLASTRKDGRERTHHTSGGEEEGRELVGREGAEGERGEDKYWLNSAMDDLTGGFVRVDIRDLPEANYEGIRTLFVRGMCRGDVERAWLSADVVRDVFAAISANTIRVRPMTPFDLYMRSIRRSWGREGRSHALEELVRACNALLHEQAKHKEGHQVSVSEGACEGGGADEQRNGAREECVGDGSTKTGSGGVAEQGMRVEVPSHEIDVHMRKLCGVEGAALYRLQCKCNHCCDSNAESISYNVIDYTIELVASRAIPNGSQISITYVDPEISAVLRRQRLLSTHGFTCWCARCMAGEVYDRKGRKWVRCASVCSREGSDAGGNAARVEAEDGWDWQEEGADDAELALFMDAFEIDEE